MFCKYCGQKIEENSVFCAYCGKKLVSDGGVGSAAYTAGTQGGRSADAAFGSNATGNAGVASAAGNAGAAGNAVAAIGSTGFQQQAARLKSMPPKKLIITCVAALFALVLVISLLSSVIGGRCDVCGKKAVKGYDYCYSCKCDISTCNSPKYSGSNYCYTHYLAVEQQNSVSTYDLKISGVKLENNSLYTVATGTFTNSSNKTVRFVKIKGSFTDSRGNTVDTDWTYAVGSEGLAPGESTKWRMSVDKDYSIKSCDVSIMDYDV